MSIIEIENLSHRFPDGTTALDRVNLSIGEGELALMAGPNGSGKTTLLKHLNGLLRPTAGTVRVAGVSVAQDPVHARRMVGMVFQEADSQIVGETVWEDVAFGPENLRLGGDEIRRRVASALSAVGLTGLSHQRPHLLSGGEKRRLAVAGILAMGSRIVVLDEPFANLDYSGLKQVLGQILSLHRSGYTLLVTTHDLEKIIDHADRLIIIQDGRIARDGSPEEALLEVESLGVRPPCTLGTCERRFRFH